MTYPVPTKDVAGFVRLCEQALRRPFLKWVDGATAAEFEPDLTAPERDIYAALLRLHRSARGLTPAEFLALKPDLAGLRAYHDLAAPTAVQTVAATKAIIRVLRALLD